MGSIPPQRRAAHVVYITPPPYLYLCSVWCAWVWCKTLRLEHDGERGCFEPFSSQQCARSRAFALPVLTAKETLRGGGREVKVFLRFLNFCACVRGGWGPCRYRGAWNPPWRTKGTKPGASPRDRAPADPTSCPPHPLCSNTPSRRAGFAPKAQDHSRSAQTQST